MKTTMLQILELATVPVIAFLLSCLIAWFAHSFSNNRDAIILGRKKIIRFGILFSLFMLVVGVMPFSKGDAYIVQVVMSGLIFIICMSTIAGGALGINIRLKRLERSQQDN